jgi:hypothetical protein
MAEKGGSKIGLWVITVVLVILAAWVYFRK